MNQTREYISVTETAKLLRASLKNSFPGVKFSVTSSRYAGGASIDVSYQNGPLPRLVDKIAKQYAGATFDGMQDLKEYHDSVLVDAQGVPRQVSFGADFVFTGRKVDTRTKAAIVQAVTSTHSAFEGQTWALDQWGGYPRTPWQKVPDSIFWWVESSLDCITGRLADIEGMSVRVGDSYHNAIQAALTEALAL